MLIFLNISLLILIIIAILRCVYKAPSFIKTIDKKEHQLYALYPLADLLLRRTPLGTLIKKKNNRADTLKALYITSKAETLQQLYWCKKISIVILVVISFNVMSLLSQLIGSSSLIIDGQFLKRPDFGEGSSQVNLSVTMDNMEEADAPASDTTPRTQDVTINLEERIFTEEELAAIFEKCFQYLETKVLGGNGSADQIYTKLSFISQIPGTSVTVDWEPDNAMLLESDGTIHNEGIDTKGIATSVMLTLTCQEHQAKRRMDFRIMPKQLNDAERLAGKLREKIAVASEESSEDSLLKLPDTLDTYQLNWTDKKHNNGSMLLLLGILFAVAAWVLTDKELDKKMSKRKEQLMLDYPELVNKFTLLVNAGMTIRQAWYKITEDYSVKAGKGKERMRYAYEEMLTTANELKLGLPENKAYEQFGKRIGLIPYIKFSSIITQNLKKGTKGFGELLMSEAMEAFEERKEAAKRLGEEAGTKLLIPMMVMLILVFMIILIPAFLAFRI